MQTILHDVIDLVCLRVKPLAHYQYPRWQLLLFVVLCSLVISLGVIDMNGPIGAQVAFLAVVNWLQLIVVARFMGWWLKPRGESQPLELLGVVVLVMTGLQFLEPLTSWLEPKAAMTAHVVLSLVSLAVLINALARVTERSRWRALAGIVSLMTLITAAFFGLLWLAVAMGWISLPDMKSVVHGISSGAASKAL